MESTGIGYTFTNYFAVIPLISHVSNMSVIALYLTQKKLKDNADSAEDTVKSIKCPRFLLFLVLVL